MELIDKARILADVWVNNIVGEEWESFAQQNDLGLPYAFGIVNGHILHLSDEAEEQIDEAWSSLCDLVDIDEDGDYLDFEHMKLTGEQA